MKELNGKKLFSYIDDVRLSDDMKEQLIARTKELIYRESEKSAIQSPKSKILGLFRPALVKQIVSAAVMCVLFTGVWVFINSNGGNNLPVSTPPVLPPEPVIGDDGYEGVPAVTDVAEDGLSATAADYSARTDSGTAVTAAPSQDVQAANSRTGTQPPQSANAVSQNAQTRNATAALQASQNAQGSQNTPSVTAAPPQFTQPPQAAVTSPRNATVPQTPATAPQQPVTQIPTQPQRTEPQTAATRPQTAAATQPQTVAATEPPPQVINYMDLSYQDIDNEQLKLMVEQEEIPPDIVGLDLKGNPISDITPLSELSNLKELRLPQNFELADITPLNDLENLTSLSLGYNFIPAEQVRELMNRFPRLRLRDYHTMLYDFIDNR